MHFYSFAMISSLLNILFIIIQKVNFTALEIHDKLRQI